MARLLVGRTSVASLLAVLSLPRKKKEGDPYPARLTMRAIRRVVGSKMTTLLSGDTK